MAGIPVPKPDYVLGGDLSQAIGKISNTLIMLVGAVALLFMLIGGFMLITSGGKAESVQKGKNAIMYALLGLIIVIASYVIVNFIISSLAK
ncbi:hypothetical protein HGB13_01075 [bacterium]|nr:hypothetical protein [bacterium]